MIDYLPINLQKTTIFSVFNWTELQSLLPYLTVVLQSFKFVRISSAGNIYV